MTYTQLQLKSVRQIFSAIVLLTGIILTFNTPLLASNKTEAQNIPADENKEQPKIVNIVNFIRLLEPRDANITEKVLYETVVNQVNLMKKYHLKGSFLLQYDALMNKDYQELLKGLPKDSFEIGAWWEIPQPLVENAGMRWRGRYPWDWHADVGFSTGYTPKERERLVDVYMNDFKEIFGYYPKSVASWFIDAHTLNYMYGKYHIEASANCKDQYGTDGYTLWGGYWNQAYYPSKVNSYMPAQNEKNQIPVPVFRMLGSDPIRQYDQGLGSARQGVISLEPVYKDAGGDKNWVEWYFDQFTQGEAIEYAYTQAGQENSFTWDAMAKGLEMQFPLIAELSDQHKVKVETLAESGKWFSENYKITPATAVTVTKDLGGSDLKTVWYNSRFYRLNLLWEDETLRVRDIHLFDENLVSDYLTGTASTNECKFFTLPFVDGYLWSKHGDLAGLRFKALVDGKEVLLKGGDPVVTSPGKGKLDISWPLTNIDGMLQLSVNEKSLEMKLNSDHLINWYVDLTTAINKELPFLSIDEKKISCESQHIKYVVDVKKGSASVADNTVFRISAKNNAIKLVFTTQDR
jgi:hypothetical protein